MVVLGSSVPKVPPLRNYSNLDSISLLLITRPSAGLRGKNTDSESLSRSFSFQLPNVLFSCAPKSAFLLPELRDSTSSRTGGILQESVAGFLLN